MKKLLLASILTISVISAKDYNKLINSSIKKGKYNLAFKYAEEKLYYDRKNNKILSKVVARDFMYLGYIESMLKKYNDAIADYTLSLKIYKTVLGERNQYTATIYNNIARAYSRTGYHLEALKYFFKSIAIYKRIEGNHIKSIAIAYDNIATNLDSLNEYKKGEDYHIKALSIFKKLKGDNRIDIAITYENLALNYYKRDEFKKALSYFKKALLIKEKKLGSKHSSVIALKKTIKLMKKRVR